MKFRIIAALCCLFIAGGGLMAQDRTAPLPPPEADTATPAPPGTDTRTPPAPGSVEPPAATGLRGLFSRASRTERPAASTTRGTTATSTPTSPSASQSGTASASGVQSDTQQAAARQQAAAAARPARPRREPTPQKRGLYAGLTSGMSFPTYTGISGSTLFYGEDPDATIAPVFGAFLGLHLGKLGVQVEAMLDFDWATDYWGRDISGLSLFVPLIVKYDIRLGDFSIQPLAGAYYNIALGDIKINDDSVPSANPPIGIMAGSAFGWNFRKGLLFLDARFAWNLGKTVVSYGYGDSQSLWHKSAFILALGYEFN